ncbi:MAG TPA: hypothetical protein VJ352_08070 [Geodermatophilus sp.]|nr:hypothetical protein [Geodermatophilus sp.]
MHTTTPLPVPAAPAPARATGPVGRRLAVTGLVVGSVLNTAEAALLQFLPERPEAVVDQLALVGEHAGVFTTRLVTGTLAIPFMAIAFLAAAGLLATRMRRTAYAAGALLLAGMWGFVGIHLMGYLQLPASQAGDLDAAAALLYAAEAHPVFLALFLAPFLLGTTLGMVTLTVGMLRSGVVARWIPAAWLVFIVLDFSVGAVGPVDPHWLWLAGALGLALHIARAGDLARSGQRRSLTS